MTCHCDRNEYQMTSFENVNGFRLIGMTASILISITMMGPTFVLINHYHIIYNYYSSHISIF